MVIFQSRALFLLWLPWVLRMSRPGKKITRKTITVSTRMRELELKERCSRSLLANVLDLEDDLRHCASTNLRTLDADDPSFAAYSAHRELHFILKEVRFITARIRKSEEEADIISDWKFAAMVVDRLCLFLFTLFTIAATVAVLLSAPHIIVQ